MNRRRHMGTVHEPSVLSRDGVAAGRVARAGSGFSKCALAGLAAAMLSACAPEVGSPRWCDMMRDTPRGDWSANDAIEFARSCLLDGED